MISALDAHLPCAYRKGFFELNGIASLSQPLSNRDIDPPTTSIDRQKVVWKCNSAKQLT
jgi:hypothetical protein